MERYQAYPEYKKSNSQWLDKIPSHWEVTFLKHILSTPITDGPHLTPAFVDEGIPFVSAEAVSGGYINFDKIRGFITEEDDVIFSQKYSPQKYDVYMIKSGATTGITAIVETDIRFNIWSPLAVMRCKDSFNPYFLLNSLRSDFFQKSVQLSWTFGTQQNIGMGTLENLTVCYPPSCEQQKIANFLDHETAKIDTLIAKQEKLIELLKEKRQAVISHAVTKGLNPDAPMKDSGVEWLGEVPEHWVVIKCGYLGRLFGSEAINEELINNFGDIPFVKVSTLSVDSFELAEKNYFVESSKISITKAKSNYVVFPKRGAAIFTNKVNIVREKSFIDPNLMGWELKEIALPEYVAHLLKLRGLSDIADVSTVPQINNKHIEPMKFPLPPLPEQREILGCLENKILLINKLVEKSDSAIKLMLERKTALISAAVTGKIDLRDWECKT